MGKIKGTPEISELRQRAEKELATEAGGTGLLSEMSPEKMAGLIDELQVHQIELKMQNDELRQIQGELEKTRNGYSHLYDFAPVGYFSVNPKGIIHEANLTIASMLGLDRSALIGQPFTRFLLRDDQDTFYKYRQRLLEMETPQSCELRLVKKDGQKFYARLECTVLKNKGNDLKQIRMAVSDVTDRKHAEKKPYRSEETLRAEEKLKQSRDLLVNLACLVPGVIYQYRLNPDGSSAFPWSSPGMNDIYEVTPEEVKEDATPVFGRLHPEDLEMVSNAIQESARTLNTFYCEFRVILPRQGLRWRWSQAQPERTEDGGTLWHGIISDISDRKQMESQLQQSQKMEAIGTLAGGIAHDFNNILAIILGNAELASDDVPDSNPASEHLKEIHLASLRAKDMIHQLLAFSRKSDEESKPIDIAPITKESMKMLRSSIPTSVEFKQHISDNACNVMCDAAQINQIVMNLVINAAHAMSEKGGLLEMTLENIILQEEKICFDWVLSPGPYVRLRMRDTGEGIEPEIMERIFDPYYTTKEVGKGTGMGLSVIHGIVKKHGGGIRVDSELGKGTVFEIYFPALEETAEEEKEPEGEIKGGSERILFVDDEESMVNLNRQHLERLGYDVKSTTKPLEALEWFRADPDQFDVIITDMNMPRMTGDRLAAEVLEIRPHMPVILCTGYSERMSAKKAEALGVSKYIEKPIALRNLASSLREVLEGK